MAIRIPPSKTPQGGSLLTSARKVADDWYQPTPAKQGPQWRLWANLPAVELWQAITLSCGIEPKDYLGDADREFELRMRIAIGNGLGKGDRPHCALVTLRDVARLAHRCGWTLPPEFPGANPLEHALDPTPPNWDRWLHVPSIELGSAIALSLGIDPKCLSSGRHLIPDSFVTRLQVAIEHLQEGGVLTKYAENATPDSIKVALDDVAALARQCNWSVPPEFPQPETTVTDLGDGLLGLGVKARESKEVAMIPASRSNPLTSVISKAYSSALDPEDKSSVWAELVRMASSPDRPAPLIGYTEGEGIKYLTETSVEFLTRKRFGERVRRALKRAKAR